MPDDSMYDSLASELEASDSGYSFSYKQHRLPRAASPMCGPDQHTQIDSELNRRLSDTEKMGEPDQPPALELREHFAIENDVPAEDVFDPVESDTEASERAKGIMRSIEAALAMPLYSGGVSCK